jgi:hypothetical protein
MPGSSGSWWPERRSDVVGAGSVLAARLVAAIGRHWAAITGANEPMLASNSTTPTTPPELFDLLTARFWPHGIDLRALLERAREEFPLLGRDEFDVDSTFLLHAISLLRSGVCKRGDLLTMEVDSFEEEWWRVVQAASAALSALRNECGVLVRDFVPYAALRSKARQGRGRQAGRDRLRRRSPQSRPQAA